MTELIREHRTHDREPQLAAAFVVPDPTPRSEPSAFPAWTIRHRARLLPREVRSYEGERSQVDRARSPDSGRDLELGEPETDEVLVEMVMGAVNPVDRYGAMGLTAPDGPVPRTLGTEGSGTVTEIPVLVHGAGVGTKRDGLWATAPSSRASR